MYTLLQYDGAYDSFVANMDSGLRASVDQRLDRLAQFGREAGPKVAKHLEDGIFECRAQRKRQQARLLWFYIKGMKIVVAVSIMKEGKVPPSEIRRAKSIRQTLKQNPVLLNELTKIH